jgi:hypothetical protein
MLLQTDSAGSKGMCSLTLLGCEFFETRRVSEEERRPLLTLRVVILALFALHSKNSQPIRVGCVASSYFPPRIACGLFSYCLEELLNSES